jgi:hypothetical protein
VAVMAGAAVACLIAAGIRITLTRYKVNYWVRTLVTFVVFFGLFFGWAFAVWQLWT